MSEVMLVLLVLGGVLVFLAVWAIATYNRLVKLRQRNLNAFSQIDVQLKRRHNLIPNLVESVKGYMKHEKETLEAVIKARAAAVYAANSATMAPGAVAGLLGVAQAEGALSGALGKFFARVEAYPELKAVETTNRLMEELVTTENKIAFARQAYNDAVSRYNSFRESFPPVLLAGKFGFEATPFLEFAGTEFRNVVEVKLS